MEVGGGYDGGGTAQHLFNRAERKHLHIYLQNDIKNIGLFMFLLWMARRGGGGGRVTRSAGGCSIYSAGQRENTHVFTYTYSMK
jgi:hypothetical protein